MSLIVTYIAWSETGVLILYVEPISTSGRCTSSVRRTTLLPLAPREASAAEGMRESPPPRAVALGLRGRRPRGRAGERAVLDAWSAFAAGLSSGFWTRYFVILRSILMADMVRTSRSSLP